MRARSQSPTIKDLLEALADEERREACRSAVVVPMHRNYPREAMVPPGYQQGGDHAVSGFGPAGSGAHVPRSAPRSPLLPLPDSRDLAAIEGFAGDRIGQTHGSSISRLVPGLRSIVVMAGLVVMLPSALYLAAPSLDLVASRMTAREPMEAAAAPVRQRNIATASVTSVAIPVATEKPAAKVVAAAPEQGTDTGRPQDEGRLAALTHARAAAAAAASQPTTRTETAPAPKETPQRSAAVEMQPRPYVVNPQPAEQSARLIARGLALVEAGQLSTARMVFEQAGQSGSGQAALQAARLFDPAELAKRGIGSEAADVAKARHWYERAAALGIAEARPLLARLPGS